MSTATVSTDRRTIRAANIVQAGDVVEVRPNIYHVRDSATGSGQWHLVAGSACGCIDARRGNRCKHVQAKDAYVAAQQPKCPTCGGATHPETRWAGKAGWLRFAICDRNGEHRGTRL